MSAVPSHCRLGNPRERSGFRNVRFCPTHLGTRGKEVGSGTCVSLPQTWEPAGKKRVPKRAFVSHRLQAHGWLVARVVMAQVVMALVGLARVVMARVGKARVVMARVRMASDGSGSDGSGSDGSGGDGSGSNGSVLSYIKCTFSPPHNLALSSSVPKHDENTQQGERTLI